MSEPQNGLKLTIEPINRSKKASRQLEKLAKAQVCKPIVRFTHYLLMNPFLKVNKETDEGLRNGCKVSKTHISSCLLYNNLKENGRYQPSLLNRKSSEMQEQKK